MPKSSTGPGRGSTTSRSGKSAPFGRVPQRTARQTKSPARLKLEKYSVRPVYFLRRVPKVILPILMAVLLLAGLLVPSPFAGFFLLILGAFLGWLLALSWPALMPASRWLRLIVTAVILAAAFWRFAGYG